MKQRRRSKKWRRYVALLVLIIAIGSLAVAIKSLLWSGGKTAQAHDTSNVPMSTPGASNSAVDRAASSAAASASGKVALGGTSADRDNADLAKSDTAQTPQLASTADSPIYAATAKDGSKLVALTFDDGPDAKYTPRILDILAENKVKATFFVVGRQASHYPDVLKRIAKEGHAIGNHSWDHADLSKVTPDEINKELTETDDTIQQIAGVSPHLFRAPYGAMSPELKKAAADKGYALIEWNVDTRDWAGSAPGDIVQTLKRTVKPGSIVLMHSFGGKNGKLDNTVEALPKIIAYLKSNNYRIVTVPELLAARP